MENVGQSKRSRILLDELFYSNISINSMLTQIVLQYELSQLSLPEDTIG